MDVHTKQQRSFNMSQIKGKNTKPEIEFRKYIWSQGIRSYRLHSKIKGKPDLYFPKKQTAIFIDGCFWHQCPICFKKPKTNKRFWGNKIRQNVKRDLDTDIFLANQGIHVLRLWEHEIKIDLKGCVEKLKKLLK
jgi:DNA mismatch endonuclease, patch repair protein